jgi:ubiquinone/menaquinone biosynthesis C-methylase UbiE
VIDLGCGPGFFTVELARLVGDSGEVIAVDLQPEMLEMVSRKVEKYKMAERVTFHRSFPDRLGLKENEPVHFVLAFYVLHETRNPRGFLEEIKDLLKPEGRVLLVEPLMHVSRRKFIRLVDLVREMGYVVQTYPRILGGRSVLLST